MKQQGRTRSVRRGKAYVYMLRCRDGSLYTGSAKDLARRLREHQAGTASKYTRTRRPVAMVWSCALRSWGAALSMERAVKDLSRAEKQALLEQRPAGGGA